MQTESDTGQIELHPVASLSSVPLASASLVDIYQFAMDTPEQRYGEHIYEVSPDDFRVG